MNAVRLIYLISLYLLECNEVFSKRELCKLIHVYFYESFYACNFRYVKNSDIFLFILVNIQG